MNISNNEDEEEKLDRKMNSIVKDCLEGMVKRRRIWGKEDYN